MHHRPARPALLVLLCFCAAGYSTFAQALEEGRTQRKIRTSKGLMAIAATRPLDENIMAASMLRSSSAWTYGLTDSSHVLHLGANPVEKTGKQWNTAAPEQTPGSDMKFFAGRLYGTYRYGEGGSTFYDHDSENNIGYYPNLTTAHENEVSRVSAQYELYGDIPTNAEIDSVTIELAISDAEPLDNSPVYAMRDGTIEIHKFTGDALDPNEGEESHFEGITSDAAYAEFSIERDDPIHNYEKTITSGPLIDDLQTIIENENVFAYGIKAGDETSDGALAQVENLNLSVFYESGGSDEDTAGLTVSDAEDFGAAVAFSADGDFALIGASGNLGAVRGEGNAYVFARQPGGSYAEKDKLTASGSAAQGFGASVAISAYGTTALVGTPFEDISAVNQGSAYVFARQPDGSYDEETRLALPAPKEGQQFGASVAISADRQRALVGAPWDHLEGGRGGAYVFDRQPGGSYALKELLSAAGSVVRSEFGSSVALSADGTFALVGAPFEDADGNTDQGSAYVFAQQSDGNYDEEARLTASDGESIDHFGSSVALGAEGQRVLIGAPDEDANGNSDQGSVYVFDRQPDGSYNEETKLTAPDGEAVDQFGKTVSLSSNGQRALIGAPNNNVNGNDDQGSAYAFTLGPADNGGGPPVPPSNLTISNANADTELVELQWQASPTPEVNYNVYRHVVPDSGSASPWEQVGTTSDTTYTDYDVLIDPVPTPDHVDFEYQVSAVGSAGEESSYSNVVSIYAYPLDPSLLP